MSISELSDFLPGSFVINKGNKNWGIGQVQSSVKNIVTINFGHVGKKVINIDEWSSWSWLGIINQG